MFKNKKVLLVDDEEDILTMLQSRLTTEGYSVLTARDGVEGLSVAKTWKPDLIILDILMPKMDGTEMSGVLKENPDPRRNTVPDLARDLSRQAGKRPFVVYAVQAGRLPERDDAVPLGMDIPAL